MFDKIRNIFWDFDGVIINSMPEREWGFKKIFYSFDSNKVEELIKYHRENGGLSRYHKIRYFFKTILKQEINDIDVQKYAQEFSVLMKKRLKDKSKLIYDSNGFIKKYFQEFNFHNVSGSDEDELNFLCSKLGVAKYFKSIHGSPTPKNDLVYNLFTNYKYNKGETCLIGDSINDKEASIKNDIRFYGYNNISLKTEGEYIDSFTMIEI